MSASQRFSGALAAGATIAFNNLVAGTIYEYAPRPRRVSLWAVQDGAAAATPLLTSVTSGTNVQVEPNTPVQTFTAGQGPNRNEHMLVSFVQGGGDKLTVTLRNSDPANTSNFRFLIEYSE